MFFVYSVIFVVPIPHGLTAASLTGILGLSAFFGKAFQRNSCAHRSLFLQQNIGTGTELRLVKNPISEPVELTKKSRTLVLIAALLAVFLGALGALIIGAAMPTIVADLGGLELYSWVFSAYMLTRTIALPLLFGKGVEPVFWTALLVSFISIIMCKMMPGRNVKP
jgi:hypothetical protein